MRMWLNREHVNLTQLVDFESNEYHVKVARTLEEACELAKASRIRLFHHNRQCSSVQEEKMKKLFLYAKLECLRVYG